MRTIKFRGRRIDNNEWVYGYLYSLQLPSGEAYMILTQDNNHLDNSLKPKYHLAFTLWVDLFIVNPVTVGQFTSLYDKNGKEIYEGDILRLEISNPSGIKKEPRLRKVVWNGFGFSIVNKFGDCICDKVCSCEHLEYTVIGNIHDNPELMKGGKE